MAHREGRKGCYLAFQPKYLLRVETPVLSLLIKVQNILIHASKLGFSEPFRKKWTVMNKIFHSVERMGREARDWRLEASEWGRC
jgi:hypothetical protein